MATDLRPFYSTTRDAIEDGGHEELNAFARLFLPKPVDNAFEDQPNYTRRNSTTAFILTSRITRGNAKIRAISRVYELPKLKTLIENFESTRDSGLKRAMRYDMIDCWDRVRLQLRPIDNAGLPLQPVTVMAAPPSKELPFGLYNFVLVKNTTGSSFGSIFSESISQHLNVRLVLIRHQNRSLCCSASSNFPARLH